MNHNFASPPTYPHRFKLSASVAMVIELQKREDAFCFDCLPTTELPPHEGTNHRPVVGKVHSNCRRAEEEKEKFEE